MSTALSLSPGATVTQQQAEREFRIYRIRPVGGPIPCQQEELARITDETPAGALLLYAGRKGLVGTPLSPTSFAVHALGQILRAEPAGASCRCLTVERVTFWDVAGLERCRRCRLPIGPSGTASPSAAPARPPGRSSNPTERSVMDATQTAEPVEETDGDVDQPAEPAAAPQSSGRVDNTKQAENLEKALLADLRKTVGRSKVKVTPKATYRRVNIGKPTAAYLTTLKSGALRVELPTGSGKYENAKVNTSEEIPAMVTRIAQVAEAAAA